MLIDISTNLFYRCTSCGKLSLFRLSVFDLSGKRPLYIQCECGNFYFSISKDKRNKYVITYPCILCNEPHTFEINRKLFWGNSQIGFACPVFETETFYSGKTQNFSQARELIQSESGAILDTIGYNTFYDVNPFVTEILSKLKHLKKRNLLFCSCGSYDIKTQIYYDRVELECACCGRKQCLDAVVEENVDDVSDLDSLVLGVSVVK